MKDALKLRQLSFGVPAALITSMALIVGLDAVTARKFAVVGGLLISGLRLGGAPPPRRPLDEV